MKVEAARWAKVVKAINFSRPTRLICKSRFLRLGY
jgi:hypothetical protein